MESKPSSLAIFPCVALLCLLLLLVAGMGACAPQPPTAEPPAPAQTEVVPAPGPAATDTAGPQPPLPLEPTPTEMAAAPVATSTPLTTELQALLAAGLAPTPTPEPGGTPLWEPMQIVVLSLEAGEAGPPLWVAYSTGMSYYDPEQNHFVAVYGYEQDAWQELGRVVLTSCAEYVGPGSLVQVPVEPSRIWLELQSGAGAHSGCYDLMSFDGQALRLEVSNFNSSPGAGEVRDLNGDGIQEVILNLTENYVFCYACSVRLPQFVVLRWDGQQLATVELSSLPGEAPEQARELNDRAVALAQAQLWQEAQDVIAQAQGLDVAGEEARETIAWNAALIDLHGQARAEQAQSGIYPILEQAFYGDYAAALEPLRGYEPEEIWTLSSPLITGTVAQGWELALGDWLSWTTNLALTVEPDLAEAYFLRGWAAFLRDPAGGEAVLDVEQAAALAPADAFYAQNLDYLRGATPVGAWQPLEPDACYALGEAMMQTLNVTVTLTTEPFSDYVGGGSGSGCQVLATGTGRDFEAFWLVADELGAMLETRGWRQDMSYAADGPTGTGRGFRLDDGLCLLSAGWQPAPEVTCPADRPISECGVTPEQQVYTIVLNCARARAAG